eukprot:COSAG01_NODE_4499_length_4972_cov_95.509542_3_plen_157_part_00
MYRLTIQRVSHLVCRRSTVIYKDVFSGDELLTDAFDIKVVDDFFLEVDGKMISVGGEDIDIGGNASAEGGGDDGEEEVVKVCNIVHSGRFQETNFGKKDYIACYKAFMKVGRATPSLQTPAPQPRWHGIAQPRPSASDVICPCVHAMGVVLRRRKL